MSYEHFSREDFLTDDYFLTWVRHPDVQNSAFWTAWLKAHPEKAATVREAVQLIRALDFEKDELPESRIQELKASIWARIDAPGREVPLSPSFPAGSSGRWYWVAASVVLLAVLSFLFYPRLTADSRVEISTGYGQTRRIVLPDSSLITLNANSRVWYSGDWQRGHRDVFLEGEAFFEVRKISHQLTDTATGYRKFSVHTSGITVEVLGTTFDVRHRHGETKVVLNTGQVKVLNHDVGKSILMKPGEAVLATRREFVKNTIDPVPYSAWKDNQLVFEDATLLEIARLLQDNYAYTVTLESSELGQRRFRGTFPADDIDILLQTLAKTLDADINKEKKTIVFHSTIPKTL